MNKAILVIDMPESCWDCPIHASYAESAFSSREFWCTVKGEDVYPKSKPDWCPLKPIPKRMEGYDSIKWQWGEYEDGWNHCIDYLIDD